jgi:hypothetical protein
MLFKIVSLYDECRILLSTVDRSTSNRYPPPTDIELENYYFSNNEAGYKIFGCYSDSGILLACVFVRFSFYNYSYIIDYVIKSPDVPIDSVIEIFNQIIIFAEHSNYYTCYARFFNRQDRVWERLLSKLSKLNRYSAVTEVIIPPKKKSSFLMYWNEIQRNIMYDKSIVVKMYSLMEEHRGFK